MAGFAEADLDVSVEENQLVVRGRQTDDTEREYLHRGIAARQFQRTFVLADGMRVTGAELRRTGSCRSTSTVRNQRSWYEKSTFR